VNNFRSVEDSEPFDIDSTTCLVGKNESGKSAILLALAALNPHPATPARLDKERDYPRRFLARYEELHPSEPARVLTTTWQLEESEQRALADIVGEGVLEASEVTITRSYGEKKANVVANVDFAKAISFLFSKFKLDASERAVLNSADTTSALLEVLKGLSSSTSKHQALKAHLETQGSVTAQVQNFVAGKLPRFMYFAAYDRMEGAIQIEHARQLVANNTIGNDENRGIRLFTEFMDYAGVSMDGITQITTYETFNAKLKAASNNITDQILEYWTQNPDLSVDVRIEPARSGDPAPLNSGTIARARIDNALHRVDTPFSERSAGFVWFFSFLVKFARVKNDGTPVVLLLDEPGLTLHGKAQADLLRFFAEKLAPHHQIIYSTHSPFMVPHDDLASVRIVEDRVEVKNNRRTPIGTRVRSDVLTRDPDTLFPLQGALGYDITQSLFIGKNVLLVEGPGDILYLQALSSALRRRGRTSLDPKWTICPAGGIDKISAFVSLFAGNALNIAALSDQAKADRRKIENLRRSEVLKAGRFFTVADFLDREEADIEDIFTPKTFADLVNAAYALEGEGRLSAEKLSAAIPSTTRNLKNAESLFKLLPDTVPEFDHFAPADWLIRNPKILDQDDQHTEWALSAAEKMFKALNGLLS
jgi:predicted ATP-dependent endonuclease of OLD family